MPIGTEANPPFTHGQYLWVITRTDDRVRRIDMRTDEARIVKADRHAWSLVAGGGSLWMSHHVVPKVVRFHDNPADPIAEYSFPTNPRGMAYARGTLWVTTEDGLYTVRDDTGEVRRLVEFGPFPADTGPIGLAVLDGSAWISIE